MQAHSAGRELLVSLGEVLFHESLARWHFKQ